MVLVEEYLRNHVTTSPIAQIKRGLELSLWRGIQESSHRACTGLGAAAAIALRTRGLCFYGILQLILNGALSPLPLLLLGWDYF